MIRALLKGVLVVAILLTSNKGFAQNCSFSLSGYLTDMQTGTPLPYSTLFLETINKGIASDASGYFEFNNLCAGTYRLRSSSIGYVAKTWLIELSNDTTVTLSLHKDIAILKEIVVEQSRADQSMQISTQVDQQEIEQGSNKNLADLLEGITGVSVLKTGAGISKPLVHGLSGNRVAILNNGVEQSGQQWGNDHAPEIDPSFANRLSVIKGAGALAYGGNALGSIVLVEADRIPSEPGLHGSINYIFQSNGLGHTLNTKFQKRNDWGAWRLNGTLKAIGDANTPDYYLSNTGRREANLSFQLEKQFSNKWFNEFYISSFNTEIGILRGSHIGNLTDLEAALERDEPFFTKDQFSYSIGTPKQRVGHHLLKWQSKYFITNSQVIRFKYGGQLNDRKEFDTRRGDRSDIPSLSLQQYSHFIEGTYQKTFSNELRLNTGLQYRYVDNTNNPETGILPLIPNYDAHNTSAFLIFQKQLTNIDLEAGGRYDLKQYYVTTISTTLPRIIERFQHQFHNFALSGGINYQIAKGLNIRANTGYMKRAPEINEMYSYGLHQGVSGIEEGNRNLESENSFKNIAGIEWAHKDKISLEALFYHQTIQNYIYLQPQNELRLTIRGAFPVFVYEQTNATIQGVDLLLSVQPNPSTKWTFKYAYVNGRDKTNDLALINIPAGNLQSTFSYSLPDGKQWKQNTLSINGNYVFEKKGILPEQDFMLPPDAYFLLGLQAGTQLTMASSTFRFSLRVENLLNVKYRDYLNRQRYFADETGINVVFNINYDF